MNKPISFLAIIALLSCSKASPELTSNPDSQLLISNFAQEFFEFYDKEHQSYIFLEKYYLKEMPLDHKAILKATIFDQNKNLINGELILNGVSYTNHPYVGYIYAGPEPQVECFNQNNSLIFEDESGNVLFDTDLNVPMEVAIHSEDTSISIGTIINFNAAPSNSLGLACLAIFSTSNPYNVNFVNHPEVTNVIHVENDNGSFAITEELLKDIPNGAMIDLVLVRGAIKSIETPNNSIGILAYSNSILSTVVHR